MNNLSKVNAPKVVLLKGNGPISINSELMELYTITTAHGAIGLPLKSLHADNVYVISELETFWTIEKEIKEKPCCFIYAYDGFSKEHYELIHTANLKVV